jgi:hypothetical protein
MAQVKIYGLRSHLDPIKPQVSDVIHACVVEALHYPPDKRAHRFFTLDAIDFFYPAGRTEKYTILEFSLFEGRSIATKKQLIRLLFQNFEQKLNIFNHDLEITLFETPKHNWGFRGLPGDEHQLDYKVEV